MTAHRKSRSLGRTWQREFERCHSPSQTDRHDDVSKVTIDGVVDRTKDRTIVVEVRVRKTVEIAHCIRAGEDERLAARVAGRGDERPAEHARHEFVERGVRQEKAEIRQSGRDRVRDEPWLWRAFVALLFVARLCVALFCVGLPRVPRGCARAITPRNEHDRMCRRKERFRRSGRHVGDLPRNVQPIFAGSGDEHGERLPRSGLPRS